MKRREFLRSVAAMPCVAVAGVVTVAPAIHTTGYLQTVGTNLTNGDYDVYPIQAIGPIGERRLRRAADYWPYGQVHGDPRDHPLSIERYSETLKVPYTAIVDLV